MCFFFFFKQKTAYEMRISDWSSDVCSSDLRPAGELVDEPGLARGKEAHPVRGKLRRHRDVDVPAHRFMGDREIIVGIGARDLRNVGKAIVDERNAGQIAARERTVDLGIVSRLDILVSMSRGCAKRESRSEEHTSELQSLMRN